jgi:hypothetical protein
MFNPIGGLKTLRLENPYQTPVFRDKVVHTPSIYGLEDDKKYIETSLPYDMHTTLNSWLA